MTGFSTSGPPTTGSATIYQFPIGGRAGLVSSQDRGRRSDEIVPADGGAYVLTDAWYHQEAIDDADTDHLATKQ